MRWRMRILLATIALFVTGILWSSSQSDRPKPKLATKEFTRPELDITSSSVPLESVRDSLPNGVAWAGFIARQPPGLDVHIDQRSGTPSSFMGRFPIIPGRGKDNHLIKEHLERELGRPVSEVDPEVVGDLVRKFVETNKSVLGIDTKQLGPAHAVQVSEGLWSIVFEQQVDGIPVRRANLQSNLNQGNMVLLGTDSWGNAHLKTKPSITSEEAERLGFEYAGGRTSRDTLWKESTLEILPVTPAGQGKWEPGKPVGRGYAHRLVWAFGFQRADEIGRWEVLVDAQSGEILSFRDTIVYETKRIEGGVYPLTNIEQCASPDKCGTMQPGYPMPWANTGLSTPNDFTTSSGRFEYTSGTVTTSLQGKYVTIDEACGSLSESSDIGRLDLLGINGQHDCVSARTSAGDTAAARTIFYEANRMAEMARSWLPTNTWLQSTLQAGANAPMGSCNAWWSGTYMAFFPSGNGCRNAGELAGIIDHEWGHGLDNNDANGTLTRPAEAYADIAAIYHLRNSCVGYGFYQSDNGFGCGPTADGTGYNNRNGAPGHCSLNCSGVRDTDWGQHADGNPDKPQFVCDSCNGAGSPITPCNREAHCAAAPITQAAWDFATRDLPSLFGYDAETAFLIANRIFLQGSSSVTDWQECMCTGEAGCADYTGYKKWLWADDDNGDITDGTPHMSALYDAFNRHGIACSTPAVHDTGCSEAPSTAPTLTVTPNVDRFNLSWTAVSGATKYWVLRSEGQQGCGQSKTLIASPTTTSYTDLEVVDGRQYCYSVVAVGTSDRCHSRASSCSCGTLPCSIPSAAPVLVSPANGAIDQLGAPALDWTDVSGAQSYPVELSKSASFDSIVRTANPPTSAWTVTPPLDSGTTYHWRVRAENSCGSSAWSTRSFTTCTNQTFSLLSPSNGATSQYGGVTLDWSDVSGVISYDVEVSTTATFTTIVRSAAVTTSYWSVDPPLVSGTTYYWRVRALTSCGISASAAFSFSICSGSTASYNSSYQVPGCASGACSCDSGGLLISRDNMLQTQEPNQPNTLSSTCADGTFGTYHSSTSSEKIVVRTLDGTAINAMDSINVRVTVWCTNASFKLYLYYTSNASSPSWTAVASGLTCPGAGEVTFSQDIVLANVVGVHAVRAQFLPGLITPTSPCHTATTADRDDLTFQVLARPPLLCQTDYCANEGIRCSWSGAPGSCCAYTDCHEDASCTGPDPLPPNACN